MDYSERFFESRPISICESGFCGEVCQTANFHTKDEKASKSTENTREHKRNREQRKSPLHIFVL
jgi:hypothetical protein